MDKQIHYGKGNNIVANTVNIVSDISRTFSDLSFIVNTLGEKLYSNEVETNNEIELAFNPEDKIEFNNVIRFKAIINEFKVFYGKLDSLYNELESQGSSKKKIILGSIKLDYIKIKNRKIKENSGESELEVIRSSADDIIEEIESNLLEIILKSSNNESSRESINLCLQIVLIDAFFRCKILEKPC